jgi:tyrosine-protein kinase Etk/Wzc
VAITEDLYADLQTRYMAAELARRSSIPDVSVLDRAVPPNEPVDGAPISIGLLIFFGVIGLFVAGVLLYDRYDSRIRTPDQVMSAFGLPVLGAIPRIQGARNGRGGSGQIRNLGQIREAFRQLRTSLEYAYGTAGPMLLTVSSSSMEEGKTLVATNLGVSFAELGLRTVILDADTRRGDVHHFLGGRRTPGLTEFLQSSATGEEVIQSTSHPGLDFIGSGARVPHSPELLSSRRMGDLLAALRKMYDVILVDSPPLGAGADPLVLGSITGHMLFVVRSGTTEKDFAMAKLEPLDRLPIRVMGVVLNDYVPDKIGAYRYYGSYLPGYDVSSEGEAEPREERIIAGVGAGSQS